MLLPNIIRSFACLFFVLALTSCGGGGGGDGGGGGGGGGGSDIATPQGRLSAAMVSGDSSKLTAEDAPYTITSLNDSYSQKLQDKKTLLLAFYAEQNSKFDLVPESQLIQPALSALDDAFPLVYGDKGNVIATFSTYGGGRIVGYGYDILGGFAKTADVVPSIQTNHRGVFKRVLAWLAFDNPNRDLSSQPADSLKIAWSSMPLSSTSMYSLTDKNKTKVYTPNAAAGLTSLNIPFKNLFCDPLTDPVADCAAKAQLVVIGGSNYGQREDMVLANAQASRIKELVAAKIPILYLNSHQSSGYNDWGSGVYAADVPRIAALGLAAPDGSGNKYKLDLVVSNTALSSANIFKIDYLGNLMDRVAKSNFVQYDWSTCIEDGDYCVLPQAFINDIVTSVNKIKILLDDVNSKGQNLFDPKVGNKTIQQLVLWADAYRKNIKYPIEKTTQSNEFQKAYIADALVAYVRKSGLAQTDLGNFLGPLVSQITGSTDMENVTVTLPGSKGFTSVGRFVLPGQALTIQLQNAPATGTDFKFFLNTAGAGNTKFFTSPVDNNGKQLINTGYRRPRFPQSPDFTLSTQPITIVSPYGGLLELRFSGATVASVVLQIKGTAKQPFYDTTQGTADAAVFLNDFQTSKLGWLEIKTPGVEIHSLISKIQELLLPALPTNTVYPNASKPYYNSSSSSIDMNKYLFEAKKYVMEDAYQLAGFQTGGLQINSRVSNFCNSHSWNCTSTSIHEPPAIQHYHTDYAANCGWMCSGNPVTSGGGFEPRGWGESHELGHNLQRFKVYDGISGEVSNNIFSLHKKWRLLIDKKRDAIGYANELEDTQVVFDMIKTSYLDTSKNRDAKIAKVRSDLWSDSNYAAQNRLRLYFYLQWPLLYADIIQDQNPLMPKADAIEAGWDIFTLMYLNLRQVEAASAGNWPSLKSALGFSKYDTKPATSSAAVNSEYPHHDYMLIVLSLITGKNQAPIFDFWGIQTTQAGRDQAADLKDSNGQTLPLQAVKFYATLCSDDLRTYTSVDMTQNNPLFPWTDKFKKSDTEPQAGTNKTTNNNYCLSLKQ